MIGSPETIWISEAFNSIALEKILSSIAIVVLFHRLGSSRGCGVDNLFRYNDFNLILAQVQKFCAYKLPIGRTEDFDIGNRNEILRLVQKVCHAGSRVEMQ